MMASCFQRVFRKDLLHVVLSVDADFLSICSACLESVPLFIVYIQRIFSVNNALSNNNSKFLLF